MVSPDALAQVPFFQELPPEARALLAQLARSRSYKAGETIFEEGGAPEALHILVEGLVSLRERARSGGEEVAIGSIEPGGIFGISALLGGDNTYTSSARCLEDSKTIELDGARLLELCETRPEAGVKVLRALTAVMAQRLRGAREQIRSRIRPGLISHG